MNAASSTVATEGLGAGSPVCGDPQFEAAVLDVLQRAAIYRVLATALVHPSRDTLGYVAVTADRLARSASTELRELLESLRHCAQHTLPSSLASEYLRIFERDSPCSPREGSWNLQGVMNRPALLADVAGFYAAFGVRVGDVLGDSEDHIAAELEFLSFLSLKLAYAMAENNEEGAAVVQDATRAFWSDHLGRFVLPFTRNLEETTTEEFYRASARLLREWAKSESRRLDVTLAETAERAARTAIEADCLVCPMSGKP